MYEKKETSFYQNVNGIDFSKELSFSISKVKEKSSVSYISNLSNLISQIKDKNQHYFCSNCYNFPYIQIINEPEIYYKCACHNEIIHINQLLKNLDLNNKKNEYDIKEITKCKHGKISHKFRYYCITCNKNLCKECCDDHLEETENLIVFDYNNKYTIKKIFEIKKLLNNMESKIDIINNNSSFFNDKENEYNIEMIDKNNCIVRKIF